MASCRSRACVYATWMVAGHEGIRASVPAWGAPALLAPVLRPGPYGKLLCSSRSSGLRATVCSSMEGNRCSAI